MSPAHYIALGLALVWAATVITFAWRRHERTEAEIERIEREEGE